VQAVRYSPNGSHFASAGFDGKVFLYDGSSADLIGEIGSPAHKGGVYAVSIKQHTPQQHVTFTASYRSWASMQYSHKATGYIFGRGKRFFSLPQMNSNMPVLYYEDPVKPLFNELLGD
jgi:WD40 repeat protein